MAVPVKGKPSKRAETPPRAAAKKPALPYTGKEFLASLDDGREIWIYGERVKNVTTHAAFQNCARMLASRTGTSGRPGTWRSRWLAATRSPPGPA